LPTIQINDKVHEPKAEESRRYRTAPKANRLAALAWTVKDGELISGNAAKRGPKQQSVIRYNRPLADGETLSYEFFYLNRSSDRRIHPLAVPLTSCVRMVCDATG